MAKKNIYIISGDDGGHDNGVDNAHTNEAYNSHVTTEIAVSELKQDAAAATKYERGLEDDAAPVDVNIPEEAKDETEEKLGPVSFLQLFRFADKTDMLLMTAGILAALVSGTAVPLNALVYGEVATAYVYYAVIQTPSYGNSTANTTTFVPMDLSEYADLLSVARSYVIYFCMLGLTAFIAGCIQHICWDISIERQMYRIKTTFFRSVVHQNMAWFDTHDGGELGSWFTKSMIDIERSIGKDTVIAIQHACSCVTCYVVAMVKSWKLTLACIAFSPLMMLVGAVLTRLLRNFAIIEQKAYAKAGSVAAEVLSSIRTVMTFNGQGKEAARYNSKLAEAGAPALSKGLIFGTGMAAVWFLVYSMLTVAFVFGASLMADREAGFEPGNILTVYIAIIVGSFTMSQGLPALETIAGGRAAAGSVFPIIDTKLSIDSSSPKGVVPASVRGRIEFKDVDFVYPSRPGVQVLNRLTLCVEPGQTVALVGHSGSGKSTVVQLIERLYDVTGGQVSLDGVDVRELNVNWLRRQIGLVSQEPVLFGTSIRENIQYGRMDVTEEEIRAAATTANIHEFISSLPEGYNTLVGDRGTKLSGGQKQRVAIARALVRKPTILLLDEATSALDNESEAVVQKALDQAKEGCTTIIVAHRLSTVKNADVIIVMKGGRVMEQGTHEELMKKGGLYQDLVKNQILHEDLTSDETPEHEKELISTRHVGTDVSQTGQTTTEKNGNDTEQEETLPPFSMKRIVQLAAPEWHWILIGVLCSVIMGAFQPAMSFFMSEYLKVLIQPADRQLSMAREIAAIVLGSAVALAICRVCQNVGFSKAGFELTNRLRNLTFQAFIRQDMAFFDDPKNRVGLLTTRLSNDATLVQAATGSNIGAALESLSVVISVIIISMVSSWKLALVVLVFLPLMTGVGVMQMKLTTGFSRADTAAVDSAGQLCSETVENIKLVTSLTSEDIFHGKYSKLVHSISRKATRRAVMTSLSLGFSSSFLFFAYASAFTYGAYLVQYEQLAFHLVFRVFSVVIFGGQHIGRTSGFSIDFAKAKFAAARIFSYLDTVPAIDIDKSGGKSVEKFSGTIQFSDVEFRYPTRLESTVLNGLSLSVASGQTIALVGESGCGKSTIVSLLDRFYDPTHGTVCLDDEHLPSLDLHWLRSQISVVSQEPVLFDCSIADNIAYGDNNRTVDMDEIIQAARRANIHNFITSLPDGYDTNVGSKGTQISGGQKQRVAIARALVSNCPILILDEATSALDSNSEKLVQEALDNARTGRTCVVIAHRLSTIKNADVIAVIRGGGVVEMGNHADLMDKKGMYYRLTQAGNLQ